MRGRQIHFFLDGEKKEKFTQLLKQMGTTQQEAFTQYVDWFLIKNGNPLEYPETIADSYTTTAMQHERKALALREISNEIRSKQEQEEIRQKELNALYERMKTLKNGKKMLSAFVKRLEFHERERAFTYFCEDNMPFLRPLFGTSDIDEIVKTSIALAEMHSN